MCETPPRFAGERIVPRPRWSVLYGITSLGLAALVIAEMVVPAGAVIAVARFVLALATISLMAVWVRLNRAALQFHEWCDCAGARVGVRVIPPGSGPGWGDDNRRWCDLLHRRVQARADEGTRIGAGPAGA